MKRDSQDLDQDEFGSGRIRIRTKKRRRGYACRRCKILERERRCGARIALPLQCAGVLFLGRVDDLERFVRRRESRYEREKDPLVLGLDLGLDRERIGLLDQLMIPVAEITLVAL